MSDDKLLRLRSSILNRINIFWCIADSKIQETEVYAPMFEQNSKVAICKFPIINPDCVINLTVNNKSHDITQVPKSSILLSVTDAMILGLELDALGDTIIVYCVK